VFFALTFVWTWIFWIPAALPGRDVMTFPTVLLIYAGGGGPMLAGLVLMYLTHDREGRIDYWRRVVGFRRIGLGWYAIIFLTPAAIMALAVLLNAVSGGEPPGFDTAGRLLSRPLTILPTVAFVFLFGPLPEELGWRGYQLDRLQSRWSALNASLILGAAWGLWHLPLFFMEGYYHHDELGGFGSTGFWLFCTGTTVESVFITWVYNNTQRSTLSAVLIHFAGNFAGYLVDHPQDLLRFYRTALLMLVAIGVTLVYGGRTLTRDQRQ
jgi:membrane protease YdiL (CAAX protease family)